MASRRRSRSSRGLRPNYLWSNVVSSRVTITAGNFGISDLTPLNRIGVLSNDLPNLTVVRTIGNVELQPASVASTVDVVMAHGLIPVSENSFAIAGAVPDPSGDPSGWVYNQTDAFLFAPGQGPASKTLHWDTKANRRLGKWDNLFVYILKNLGGASLDVRVNMRILFRWP